MDTVGAVEARTHLSSLPERVAKGAAHHYEAWQSGARVVPLEQRSPEQIKEVMTRLEEFAAGQTLDGDWKEFRDAGRK
jgi:antitoxin (DNA-binding transcriptional repressor) of toxin-antitoxin stability system